MTDFKNEFEQYAASVNKWLNMEQVESPARPLACTAVHEAGHVVVAVHLDISIDEVTIVSSADNSGHAVWNSPDWSKLKQAMASSIRNAEIRGIAQNFAKILLGGRCAERLFHDDPPSEHWMGDRDCFNRITTWLEELGPSPSELRRQLELETGEIVNQRNRDVLCIAEALLVWKKLDAKQIRDLLTTV